MKESMRHINVEGQGQGARKMTAIERCEHRIAELKMAIIQAELQEAIHAERRICLAASVNHDMGTLALLKREAGQ